MTIKNWLQCLILAAISAMTLVLSGDSLADVLDQRERTIRQAALRLSLAERRSCILQSSLGFNNGRTSYLWNIPNCNEYYYLSDGTVGIFRNIKMWTSDETDFFTSCYNSGWLTGFLERHQERWQPCLEQLNEERKVALEKKKEDCRKLVADKSSLADVFAMDDETLDVSKLHSSYLGLETTAEEWDLILTFESESTYQSIPCFAALLGEKP
ncbi:MAG: hypothetical protein HRU19_01220 [Pseudobacteriovorax sp.]|nr:hypothetical protein [Pseudobacteriovorax sp.]